jgi:hypothetical protein
MHYVPFDDSIAETVILIHKVADFQSIYHCDDITESEHNQVNASMNQINTAILRETDPKERLLVIGLSELKQQAAWPAHHARKAQAGPCREALFA